MGDYYTDIYLKRLNRYGTNYQDRIQNQREENFERQLMKSVYKVEFEFNGATCAGELVKYQQDNSKTLQYLLTPMSVEIPNGTIVKIGQTEFEDGEAHMIYWKEDIQASGYNKYVVLKMSHYITWWENDIEYHSWAYMYGQENNMLKDELKSRSRMDTLYSENLKASFFILPFNKHLVKDNYFEVSRNGVVEAYRVTGMDRQSTEGVMFVTIDPIYKYDHTERIKYYGDEEYTSPATEETNTADEYYWSQMKEVDDDGRRNRDK